METYTVVTHGAGETRALGAALAPSLEAGDTVVLSGGLGAGKSEFSRGVARGLGVTGPVPSPSFTILNVYEAGRIPLYHFDWYRIGDVQELYDAGLDEMIGGDGASLIEWAERAPECVPPAHLRVDIRKGEGDERTVTLTCVGGFHPISLKEAAR